MKIATYVIRFLLALIFIYAGIEKLFLPYDPSVFKADISMTDPQFFVFYDLLMKAGFLYFVGFFQLLNGLLLVFKRTYLIGAVMMVPLLLCLLMSQVFIAKYIWFILFDSTLFVLNALLIAPHFKELKSVFLKKQKNLF